MGLKLTLSRLSLFGTLRGLVIVKWPRFVPCPRKTAAIWQAKWLIIITFHWLKESKSQKNDIMKCFKNPPFNFNGVESLLIFNGSDSRALHVVVGKFFGSPILRSKKWPPVSVLMRVTFQRASMIHEWACPRILKAPLKLLGSELGSHEVLTQPHWLMVKHIVLCLNC